VAPRPPEGFFPLEDQGFFRIEAQRGRAVIGQGPRTCRPERTLSGRERRGLSTASDLKILVQQSLPDRGLPARETGTRATGRVGSEGELADDQCAAARIGEALRVILACIILEQAAGFGDLLRQRSCACPFGVCRAWRQTKISRAIGDLPD